ncbi:hypothetical protein [uncultured Microbacterium sp.]|uniref:hypothetical protein n=1 Tax=uncultured Microbacterium sp. TaxID=191216 RepID=UPI0028EBBE13|nr:hypothetical protein [uncultured Microbacterium sp.]
MSDQLFSFGSDTTDDARPAETVMMSDAQRTTIRALFSQLGVTDAKNQFVIVGELTGTTIGSVSELTASVAARLIERLRARVADAGKARTGKAWDDREEDTWIDRL